MLKNSKNIVREFPERVAAMKQVMVEFDASLKETSRPPGSVNP